MKVIFITILITGSICGALLFGIHQKKDALARSLNDTEVAKESREENQAHSHRRSTRERITFPTTNSSRNEDEQIDDMVAQLAHYDLDQLKAFAEDHLSYQNSKQPLEREAVLMALSEADPLWVLQSFDTYRTEHPGTPPEIRWMITAYSSLLRQTPKAAEQYFATIDPADLARNRSPFSRIYTMTMGHFLKNQPQQAMQTFLSLKPAIRNLPKREALRIDSLEVVHELSPLIQEIPYDGSKRTIVDLLAAETLRLGGFQELVSFLDGQLAADPFMKRVAEMREQHTLAELATPENAKEMWQYYSSINEAPPSSLVFSFTSFWAWSDYAGAVEWVQSLPAGPQRDPALDALISNLEDTDPKAAAQWVPLIHDEKQREAYSRKFQQ